VEDEVVRILQNEGFLSAAAEAQLVNFHDPDRATLQVAVAAGARTRIADVEIRNDSPLDEKRIQSQLGIERGAPYRARALQTALAELRDDLRARRFYAAIAQDQPPTFSADGTEASLVVIVRAGPRVEVRVVGELPGREDDFIPIRRQSSVDTDLLEDSRNSIDDALRRQGYWRAQTRFTREQPSDTEMVITFTIERGRRYRIARVEWPADLLVEPEEIRKLEALRPGEWFDQNGVELALLVIQSRYQERGYHQVVFAPEYVDDAEATRPGEGRVVIRPNITPGPRATVREITFDLGERPFVTEAALRAVMQLTPGGPYVLGQLVLDQQRVLRHYEGLGFLGRTLTITPTLNAAATEATIAVVVREGPQVRVGEIMVIGNRAMSRDEVLREVTLRVGEPFSEAARAESRLRLYNLGFRSVRIEADDRLPGESVVRVVIVVEESDRTTFGIGGGLEAGTRARQAEDGTFEDKLEFAPRAFVEVGRRNLGGRNRAVNAYARVSFKQRTAANADPDPPGLGFIEYRATASYRERYAFRSSTDVVFSVTSEQAFRSTFNFIRRVATLEMIGPVRPRTTVSGRYSLEWTRLFDEVLSPDDQPLIDRLFPQVRLSIFSGGVTWDRRNDAVATTRGGQVTANLDVALRPLGSEVGFSKLFSQASFFRPIVESGRPITFAGRIQFGVARGFQRTVPVLDPDGQPVLDPDGHPLQQVVADLPASHRFFSGGGSTVRGFQIDRLGVPEILDGNGLSNGGNGLIVLNAEIRAVVARLFNRDLSVVGFVDGGNVFNRAADLDLTRLRSAIGFGVRYDSPLGPLRLDFGFKTERLVFANGRERRWEFHLSIGEVF
jgi:outer membrane protein assembly factor BamA